MLPDQDLDEDEQSEPSSLSAEERKLTTQSYDLSVNTLIEQWNDETLILPDIQREYVWSNATASRLIESLLLNVPIPVLYFAETGDQYEVIDGHQRVNSIVRYVDNQFALSGLKVLADGAHRRKRFHELPPADQRRIKTRVIRAIIITEESHPAMKFEVFERLNTGSIALNAQEVRNSTHRGPFMDKVKELVKYRSFRSTIGSKSPRKRMVDNELIIRFFALAHGSENYKPPLQRFLNNFCASANRFDSNTLKNESNRFHRAADNANALFGSAAFRLTDEAGHLIERNINRALAETQLVTLSEYSTSEIQTSRDVLLRHLGALHRDDEFLDTIQRATGDRARTLRRLEMYRRVLSNAGMTPTAQA